MKLEEIGFYTLEDNRAKNASVDSPLWRNELIITSRCNFNCPYCRGTDINGEKGDMKLEDVKHVIDLWAKENIQNIRFSGGEPTIHPNFKEIIKYTKDICKNIKHIAVSTNGFQPIEYYYELIKLGVNDFSISLDACCSSVGDIMAGGIDGAWKLVTSNIREISKLTYVTVGMVFDKQNVSQMKETIEFAHDLGVADIRIISAAQWNDFSIFENLELGENILNSHPILKYRVNNFKQKRNVRGIQDTDARKCGLMLDDMIVKGKYHYPCVIKMREGCEPIGEINENTRKDRENYYKNHNCYKDEICKKNCLDVCVDYNNKFMRYKVENTNLPKIDSSNFTKDIWNAGSIHDLGIQSRYDEIIKSNSKMILKKYAIGWCYGENLICRPKNNHIAIMFNVDDSIFWFHIRTNEFIEVFC
jgi:MoaA/NifB/PqqE/SkfB family radical SAM enzyme